MFSGVVRDLSIFLSHISTKEVKTNRFSFRDVTFARNRSVPASVRFLQVPTHLENSVQWCDPCRSAISVEWSKTSPLISIDKCTVQWIRCLCSLYRIRLEVGYVLCFSSVYEHTTINHWKCYIYKQEEEKRHFIIRQNQCEVVRKSRWLSQWPQSMNDNLVTPFLGMNRSRL